MFEIDFAIHHALSYGIFTGCYLGDQTSVLEILLQLHEATISACRSPNVAPVHEVDIAHPKTIRDNIRRPLHLDFPSPVNDRRLRERSQAS
jgi:hypothetical protein